MTEVSSVVFLFKREDFMSNITEISSKDNQIIKRICNLQKSSKSRREEGVFVLEGQRLCIDARGCGCSPEIFIMSHSAEMRYPDDCKILSDTAKFSYRVSDTLFAKISDTVGPQGLLCVCKTPEFTESALFSEGKYIALENLQDPTNLGAISRTADALGIDGMILQDCCDPYSPKSLRASMGALIRIPIIQTDNMFDIFSNYGLTSYAAVIDSEAETLSTVHFDFGSVAVIGNEGNGLKKESVAKCTTRITIPMKSTTESLNAAVAASIIMWEMCK